MLRSLLVSLVSFLFVAPACLTANVAAEYVPATLSGGLDFYGFWPTNTRNATQTFLALEGGEVTTVEVPVLTQLWYHDAITVSLLPTTALGIPLGGPSNVLGSIVVPSAAVPLVTPPGDLPNPWITVDFSALHLALTSGQTYALELRSFTTTFWLGNWENSYADGGAFFAFTSGPAYLAAPVGADLAFRVNVTPIVKPPTSSTVPDNGATACLMLISCGVLVLRCGRRSVVA